MFKLRRTRHLFLVMLLLGLLLPPSTTPRPAQAQNAPTSVGTEFWLAFTRSPDGEGLWYQEQELSLFISSETDATGIVEVGAAGFTPLTFTVSAGGSTVVELPQPGTAANGPHPGSAANGISSHSVHVTADAPISVYGLYFVTWNVDAFLALPTSGSGTRFVVPSYVTSESLGTEGYFNSGFTLVAQQDDTVITYLPRSSAPFAVDGAQASELYLSEIPDFGQAQKVTLDRGEVFVYSTESAADPSGTLIESNKPISAYGYASCAEVPVNIGYCDHLVEGLLPIENWGTEYIAPPAPNRSYSDTFRGFAYVDDTVISLNGVELTTLAAGQFFEYRQRSNSALQFSGSQPFMLVRYFNGTNWDSKSADPSMMIMAPVEQGLAAYSVSTVTGISNYVHSLSVVKPDSAEIVLNGTPLTDWASVGSTGYSYTTVTIDEGAQELTGTAPFQVYVSGLRSAESYAYPGGMNLQTLWNPSPLLASAEEETVVRRLPECRDETDVAVSPQFIELAAGGQATVTIAVRNTGSVPAGSHDVLLSLSDGLSVVGSSSDVVNLGQRAALQDVVLEPNETRSFDVTVQAAAALPTAPLHITELYCAGRVVERIDGVFLTPQPAVAAPSPTPEPVAAIVPTAPPTQLPTTLPNTAGDDPLMWLTLSAAAAFGGLALGRRLLFRR